MLTVSFFHFFILKKLVLDGFFFLFLTQLNDLLPCFDNFKGGLSERAHFMNFYWKTAATARPDSTAWFGYNNGANNQLFLSMVMACSFILLPFVKSCYV